MAPASGGASIFSLLAFLAEQRFPQLLLSPLFRHDPWPFDPWWIVADVLSVAAFKVSNPVAAFVLVKADDFSFQEFSPPPVFLPRGGAYSDFPPLLQLILPFQSLFSLACLLTSNQSRSRSPSKFTARTTPIRARPGAMTICGATSM